MYCATCGSLINEELNYCNRCGNRVVKNELTTRMDLNVSVLKSLSIATGFVGLAGLGGLVGLITILVGNGVAPKVIAVLSLMFAATAFGICFLLTRQISRVNDSTFTTKQNSKQNSAPEQLNSTVAGQIESPRKPFISVTENTTQTLDKTKA